MYCPKCGTQINEGAAFCPQCGTPLSTPSQSQRAAAQEQNFQPQNFQNNEGTFNTVTPPKKKKERHYYYCYHRRAFDRRRNRHCRFTDKGPQS